MIKLGDILIVLLEMMVYFVLAIFILETTDYPFMVLVLLIVFLFIHYSIKRRKRVLKYVEKDFHKLGYNLIDEKPTAFSFSIKPSAEVGGLSIGRYAYMRRFERIFTAKTNKGKDIEIEAIITKKWDGSIEIDIVDQEEL